MTTPEEEEPVFTPQEEEIIRAALTILPHLGPDATAEYIQRASDTLGDD